MKINPEPIVDIDHNSKVSVSGDKGVRARFLNDEKTTEPYPESQARFSGLQAGQESSRFTQQQDYVRNTSCRRFADEDTEVSSFVQHCDEETSCPRERPEVEEARLSKEASDNEESRISKHFQNTEEPGYPKQFPDCTSTPLMPGRKYLLVSVVQHLSF